MRWIAVPALGLLVLGCTPELDKETATRLLTGEVCPQVVTEPGCADAMIVGTVRLDGDLRYVDNALVNLGTIQRTTEDWVLVRLSSAVQTYLAADSVAQEIRVFATEIPDPVEMRRKHRLEEEIAKRKLLSVHRANRRHIAAHGNGNIVQSSLRRYAPDEDDWSGIEIVITEGRYWLAYTDLSEGYRCWIRGRWSNRVPRLPDDGKPQCSAEEAEALALAELERLYALHAKLLSALPEGWRWLPIANHAGEE